MVNESQADSLRGTRDRRCAYVEKPAGVIVSQKNLASAGRDLPTKIRAVVGGPKHPGADHTTLSGQGHYHHMHLRQAPENRHQTIANVLG